MPATVLLIGTKRGLFVARSDAARENWALSDPLLAGREVFHAIIDPRDRRTAWAATRHAVWGAHIHRSEDGGETWDVLEAGPGHADERGLEAVWFLAPGPADRPHRLYAGVEPAGLFVSDDRGGTWRAVESLNEHPTRDSWQPAGGGLALHSIQHDPADPQRMFCAISAGGVYRSDDGGESWSPCNRGVRADFLPQRYPDTGHCVHKLRAHPALPGRLYQQNHCGTYRSDDGGAQWHEITEGLPSDFGYALALDPEDPDVLFVIPEESSHMRTTVAGQLRVFRSVDAGENWRPLTRGLPQRHAFVSVLREGMCVDGAHPAGLYLGTSGGHLFASRDSGESFRLIAGFLPRILSVSAMSFD